MLLQNRKKIQSRNPGIPTSKSRDTLEKKPRSLAMSLIYHIQQYGQKVHPKNATLPRSFMKIDQMDQNLQSLSISKMTANAILDII